MHLSRLTLLFPFLVAVMVLAAPAASHPGRTASDGCHYCRTNCAKWNETEDARHCHDAKKKSTSKSAESKKSRAKDSAKSRSSSANKGALREGNRVYVEKVLDGDTLLVRVLPGGSQKIKIRILGIDCPESHKNSKCVRDGKQGRANCDQQVPLGKKAAKHAASLLKHKVVTLESGNDDGKFKKGGFGRTLAYVRMANGADYGLHMVKNKMCQDYDWKYSHPRGEDYPDANTVTF